MSYDPDDMMLELFRAEVDSHSDSLTNSLLKLEQDPEATGLLDGMMRAAHSIKGAARIVRVDPAVDIAHVMEDCFVAAQRGELVLESAGIDVMLRSVDLLVQVSEASKDPNVQWSTFQPIIKGTVAQLRSVLNGQPIAEATQQAPSKQAAPESRVDAEPFVAPTNSAPTQSIASEPVHAPERQVAADPIVDKQFHKESTSKVSALKEKPAKEKKPKKTKEKSANPLLIPTSSSNRIQIPAFLGIKSAESIRLQFLGALEHEPRHSELIFDMSQSKDLDAVGLAFLHSAMKYARLMNRDVKFEKESHAMRTVLQAIGVGSKA